MTVNAIREEEKLTLQMEGRIDSSTSDDFQKAIDENFTDDVGDIVLDFGGVDFISSKGLRVLVSLYKKLEGREMKITGANASVKEVLRLSGLLKKFDVD